MVKKGELEIRVHGNTFFAGWKVPILLFPQPYTLPPSCILFEGYGKAKTDAFMTIFPSGFKVKTECNSFEAFITFMHPSSKYTGPGTEGYFARDVVMDIIPP